MIKLFNSPEMVAQLLLKTNCVTLSPHKPFTYASGLKGPIYCDNRLVLGYPKAREKIIEQLILLIQKIELTSEIDIIAGLATAGIPYASIIAHELKKPLIYVRAKGKEHGKKNQIEGSYKEGNRVLLIEDLVNQGVSLNSAMQAMREGKLHISSCICIMTYQTKQSIEILKQLGINLYALTNIFSLIKSAKESGYIDETEAKLIESWQNDPLNWKC